jgi:hypothetical protein
MKVMNSLKIFEQFEELKGILEYALGPDALRWYKSQRDKKMESSKKVS